MGDVVTLPGRTKVEKRGRPKSASKAVVVELITILEELVGRFYGLSDAERHRLMRALRELRR